VSKVLPKYFLILHQPPAEWERVNQQIGPVYVEGDVEANMLVMRLSLHCSEPPVKIVDGP
jgi:hypothetical protein